jgi:hypothetical protein
VERLQVTGSSEGKGNRRRFQVHIITGVGDLTLYDLKVKEMKLLRDLFDIMLTESAKA